MEKTIAAMLWGFASLGVRNEALMSVTAAEVVNKINRSNGFYDGTILQCNKSIMERVNLEAFLLADSTSDGFQAYQKLV